MASTLVSTFIDDLRYDLEDSGKAKYDDTYLVTMLNRVIKVLERELISINSGLTVHKTTGTLSSGASTMALSSVVDNVKRVYIGQDELYFIPLGDLYRYQVEVIGSGTGQPEYYSTWGKVS